MRALVRCALLAVALVVPSAFVATSSPTPASAEQQPPPRVGWWAGQVLAGSCASPDPTTCPRDNSAYTDEVWDVLAEGDGFLNFNLVYGSDFGPSMPGVNRRTDAIPVIREANARGVEINAWITAPLSKDVFANESNADVMFDAVKALDTWAAENDLDFGQVDLDLEFPIGYKHIYEALVEGDLSWFEDLAPANLDPSHQCEAAQTYRDIITWARRHNVTLSGSPVFMALEDVRDGNLAMADLMELAPMLGGYDELYVQSYRAFGVDLGSGLVATHFREIQALYGDRGQVSLGNTGMPPYTTTAPVVADIRMLAALGAAKIPIFDFSSSVDTYGIAGIADILAAAHDPMSSIELAAAEQMSPTGTALRSMLAGLDAFATAATPVVTTAAWHPQWPNRVGGCAT